MNGVPSLTRTLLCSAVSLVVGVVCPVNAQESSDIGDPFDAPTFRHSIGAPLAVDVLESDSFGITLRVRPERPAASRDVPLSYSALIGVPTGELRPVEVTDVAFIPAGGTSVETGPWTGAEGIQEGSEVAVLEALGWLRHQRIARLIVRPWMIDPLASVSPQLHSMTLRIAFAEPVARTEPRTDSGVFEQILRHSLVNYPDAVGYRSEMQGPAPVLAGLVPDPGGEHVLIETGGSGLHALTGAQLRRAGVDLSGIDARRLKLWHLGRELPLHLEPDGKRLADETVIVFFAPAIPEKYSEVAPANVLGLSWDGENGRRMTALSPVTGPVSRQASEFEALRRIEKDRVRIENDREVGNTWFWHRLSAERGAPDSRFLVIPDVKTLVTGKSAHLLVSLHGLTEVRGATDDHHIRVIVNNRWTKDFVWKGKAPFLVDEVLSSDLLVEGDNVVEVRATGELEVFADQVLIDWLELGFPTWGESGGVFVFTNRRDNPGPVEYRVYGRRGSQVRVFDITDSHHPMLVSDPQTHREDLDSVTFQVDWSKPGERSFAVTSVDALLKPLSIELKPSGRHLLEGMPQTDLLVIAHPTFRSGLERLAAHHGERGLRTVVVETDEVYDHFSYGFPTADAIRTLCAAAVHLWPRPAPSFVLLVGDASNDPLDRLEYGAPDLVPTYLPADSAFPSDSWFGLVSGDDPITDLSIGRLSLTSVAALQVVIDKIIGYESLTPDQEWKKRVLLVADDHARHAYSEEADTAGLRMTELGFQTHELFLDEIGLDPRSSYAERVEQTGRAFFPRLRDAINHGAGLVHYFGHGGHRIWAHEHILDARPETPHLDQLQNRDRLPVILSFSCINAAFDTPRFETIAERLVNWPKGGAVAFWGSGSNNNPVVRWAVAAAISDTSNETEPLRLGTALMLATLDTVRANGFMRQAPPDANILLGDPALVLDFPLSERISH